MAPQYTNYIQTENLIKSWLDIKFTKESLAVELNKFIVQSLDYEEIDSSIYSQSIGNKVLGDIPTAQGRISDSTGDTAIRYQRVIHNQYTTSLEWIQEELNLISLVDEKLDIGFRRLSCSQQKILNFFYLENKTWAETLEGLNAEKCFITKQQAQRQRRDGIYKIQRISKITIDAYLKVIELLGVE